MVVPVLDLMGGQVVRGMQGNRQAYRPIVSQLCAGSDPATVAAALLRHTGSTVLYVADLDAITGGVLQAGVLAQVMDAHPALELWLDGGFAGPEAVQALQAQWQAAPGRLARLRPVYGSESLASPQALQAACSAPGRPLLSLDRRGSQVLDPAGAWQAPALWPADVIVMTLERVGAGTGPDLDTLRAVQARRPDVRLIGAGGVRGPADLQAAAAAGAHAWLVASALHDGRL